MYIILFHPLFSFEGFLQIFLQYKYAGKPPYLRHTKPGMHAKSIQTQAGIVAITFLPCHDLLLQLNKRPD